MDLGAFPEDQRLQIDELFIETQPAHLQKSSQQKLNAEERDHLRAQMMGERLRLFPKPNISKMARQSGGEAVGSPSKSDKFKHPGDRGCGNVRHITRPL